VQVTRRRKLPKVWALCKQSKQMEISMTTKRNLGWGWGLTPDRFWILFPVPAPYDRGNTAHNSLLSIFSCHFLTTFRRSTLSSLALGPTSRHPARCPLPDSRLAVPTCPPGHLTARPRPLNQTNECVHPYTRNTNPLPSSPAFLPLAQSACVRPRGKHPLFPPLPSLPCSCASRALRAMN